MKSNLLKKILIQRFYKVQPTGRMAVRSGLGLNCERPDADEYKIAAFFQNLGMKSVALNECRMFSLWGRLL